MNLGNGSSNSVSDRESKENCSGSSRSKQCYEIRFKGHLGDHWAAWFHGCSLSREEDGSTTMIAPVIDQADLFGLLNKVRDLSLSLISVNKVEFPDDTTDLKIRSQRNE
jgi:hypothetical protein